jgi:hypothetical protein
MLAPVELFPTLEIGAALIKKIKTKIVQNQRLKWAIYRYEHAE